MFISLIVPLISASRTVTVFVVKSPISFKSVAAKVTLLRSLSEISASPNFIFALLASNILCAFPNNLTLFNTSTSPVDTSSSIKNRSSTSTDVIAMSLSEISIALFILRSVAIALLISVTVPVICTAFEISTRVVVLFANVNISPPSRLEPAASFTITVVAVLSDASG